MSSRKYNAFDHGGHNLKVHQALCGLDIPCADWQITTAFYSSLKFLEGTLFPNNYEHPNAKSGISAFETFQQYHRAYSQAGGVHSSRHQVMKRLAQEHTNEDVGFRFKELHELSNGARYTNYQVEAEELALAKESLEVVRLYCVENQA
ncbi:MAG: hypothetical protein NXI09_14735 [Bacteroidetes bacterium]|nr:hypothetical protein [Bacteroidota bacterium]